MLQGGRGCRYLQYNVSMKGLKSVIAVCCHSWRLPKFYESILWVQFPLLTIRKAAGDFFILSGYQYYEAVFASLGVFLSFYVIAAVIGCVYHGWWVCYVHTVVLEHTVWSTRCLVSSSVSVLDSEAISLWMPLLLCLKSWCVQLLCDCCSFVLFVIIQASFKEIGGKKK